MSIKSFLGSSLLLTCFVLSSCGGGGGGNSNGSGSNGGGTADTTPPSGYTVSFTTDPIDATNEASVSFRVTGAEVGASYQYSLTSGSSELDGSGAVSQANFDITGIDLSGFPAGVIDLALFLTDNAGNQGAAAADSVQKTNEPVVVTLSGNVTFDFVTRNPNAPFGLDYDNIERRPVRGATVQILEQFGAVLATTETDDDGDYSVTLDPDQDVRVRVMAELFRDGVPSWDFSVTDNTSGDALYVLDGSISNLGGTNQIRDLHAPSGWGFPGYTAERAAAPFAILDTVYQIVQKFVEVDPSIEFPATEFRWSENNVPEDGDLTQGQISTSSYRSNGTTGNVFILGAEDVDTDEYDPHVIVHEWGHYFEDQLSRSDSIGGSHTLEDHLDMRVAFGEGWGNALSAMILDDSVYIDTGGVEQGRAGGFDIELNDGSQFPEFDPAIGWYSEFSVQSILYDLYDANEDGPDNLSLGLAPIYEVLTDEQYRTQGTVTAIFSFLEQLRTDNSTDIAGIDALAAAQDISGQGFDGLGETNDGDVPDALPVYNSIVVGGAAVEVCSVNTQGEFNGLGNRQFLRFSLPASGVYGFNVERVSGSSEADPEIIFIGPFPPLGERIIRFSCGEPNSGNTETINCGGLLAGEHVLEVFDAGNTDNEDDTGGEACFSVEITDLN